MTECVVCADITERYDCLCTYRKLMLALDYISIYVSVPMYCKQVIHKCCSGMSPTFISLVWG